MCMYATTAARTLLGQKWKQQELPTLEDWQVKMMEYGEMAKLTGKIRNQCDELFRKDWNKFIFSMKENCKHLKMFVGLN